eukprot:8359504-Lingulodinium_polyedra.AAC.1
MTKFVQEQAAGSSEGPKGTSSATPNEEDAPDLLEDEEIQAVFRSLEEKRQAWDLHAPDEHADFK